MFNENVVELEAECVIILHFLCINLISYPWYNHDACLGNLYESKSPLVSLGFRQFAI